MAGTTIEVHYDTLCQPYGWSAAVVDATGRLEQVEALLGYEPIRDALAQLAEDADEDDVRDAVELALEGTTLEGAAVEVRS